MHSTPHSSPSATASPAASARRALRTRAAGRLAALIMLMLKLTSPALLHAGAPALPADSIPADSIPAATAVAPAGSIPADSVGAPAQASPSGQPRIVPFQRDIKMLTFIPKGQWITGVSVSYSQSHQNSYTFFILENLNGDTYSFKVSPMLMYCFKDNLAIGGRFAYKRSRSQLDTGLFNLGDDTSYELENVYSINHTFSGDIAFRNYLSLGNSLRFGFFNEVDLSFGGGQSKAINGRGVDLTGTYSTNFNFSVGLQPGMVVFLSDYSAIEVNVGVLGFEYTRIKNVTDQIYHAQITTKSANFRVNLFSITFGAVFYL